MATEHLFAVSGASGQVGGRVARRLSDQGVPLRLLARDAGRAPTGPDAEVYASEYRDGEGMKRALEGVHTLFLVSAKESDTRVVAHATAVGAAVAAGVERIVYLSFIGAAPDATFTLTRDHWHTEQHIRGTGLRHTFLRDSMYMDYLPFLADRDGVIRGPAGDGRLAAVARDDIADAAAAVLLDESGAQDGRMYQLTGPERLSLAEIAEELTRVTSRPILYQEQTLEEAYASRAAIRAADWEIAARVSSYAAIAAGELDVVTDDVELLSGHAPMDLHEFLLANPQSWARLARDAPPD